MALIKPLEIPTIGWCRPTVRETPNDPRSLERAISAIRMTELTPRLTRRLMCRLTRRRVGDREVFEVDLPGVAPRDVSVEIDDGRLTIVASRSESEMTRISEPLGFWPVGDPSARLERGVLTIEIPRQAKLVVPVSAG